MRKEIRLVLADDHVMLRTGLRMLLEAQPDLRVVGEAKDGREAMALVAQHQPDVAILDITMPELNGIEVTRQIRAQHLPTQVIILSMHATLSHIQHALSAGANGYVLKEVAINELIDAIHAVVAGQRFFSTKIENELLEENIAQPSGEEQTGLAVLNDHERTILQLVVEGKTTKQIGELLHFSTKTVESYRRRIMQKLNIPNLPGLVKFAIQHGLISLE